MSDYKNKLDSTVCPDCKPTWVYDQDADDYLLAKNINKKLVEVHEKIAALSEKLGIQTVMQEVLIENNAEVKTYELTESARQLGKLEGLIEAYNTVKYDPEVDTL